LNDSSDDSKLGDVPPSPGDLDPKLEPELCGSYSDDSSESEDLDDSLSALLVMLLSRFAPHGMRARGSRNGVVALLRFSSWIRAADSFLIREALRRFRMYLPTQMPITRRRITAAKVLALFSMSSSRRPAVWSDPSMIIWQNPSTRPFEAVILMPEQRSV